MYPSKIFLSLEVSLILLVVVTVMEVQDLEQKEKWLSRSGSQEGKIKPDLRNV